MQAVGDMPPDLAAVLTGQGTGPQHVVRSVDDMATALRHLDEEPIDLVLLDLRPNADEDALRRLKRLRDHSPSVPVIVVLAEGRDELALTVLRAGAQDCLIRGDELRPVMSNAVRFAIERSLYQTDLVRTRVQDAREREADGLHSLYGPQLLPVTQQSFGQQTLRMQWPQDFEVLSSEYGAVLDRVLDVAGQGDDAEVTERIDRIVDRLGSLSAGPRDVIDLHKAAIASRVDAVPAKKALAYVDEGRLILLKLMGQLVSYYRSLSWGGRVSRRPANPAV